MARLLTLKTFTCQKQLGVFSGHLDRFWKQDLWIFVLSVKSNGLPVLFCRLCCHQNPSPPAAVCWRGPWRSWPLWLCQLQTEPEPAAPCRRFYHIKSSTSIAHPFQPEPFQNLSDGPSEQTQTYGSEHKDFCCGSLQVQSLIVLWFWLGQVLWCVVMGCCQWKVLLWVSAGPRSEHPPGSVQRHPFGGEHRSVYRRRDAGCSSGFHLSCLGRESETSRP